MMNNNTLQLFDNTINKELINSIDFDNTLTLKSYQIIEWENKNYYNHTLKTIKEIFKDVLGYEGHYMVSNCGNIKSLKRNGERVLNPSIDKTNGYYRVNLYKNNKRKSCYIHQLVAIVFLGHTPNGNENVVDHIDHDKTNNKLENLQIISNRENLSKDKWRYNLTSLYTGVSFHSIKKKWGSSIFANGESLHLGYFSSEIVAGKEYKKALEYYIENLELTNYPFRTKRRNVNYTNINQLTIVFTQN